MPVVYDFRCRNQECEKRHIQFESLLKRWDSPDPMCPACGQQLERQFCAPRLGWITKPFNEMDLREEHKAAGMYNPEGMMVTRRKTSLDGKPRRDLVKSRQELNEFCDAEGYYRPEDLPPTVEVDSTGRKLLMTGNKGQWV